MGRAPCGRLWRDGVVSTKCLAGLSPRGSASVVSACCGFIIQTLHCWWFSGCREVGCRLAAEPRTCILLLHTSWFGVLVGCVATDASRSIVLTAISAN
jgi:hypothetical protein